MPRGVGRHDARVRRAGRRDAPSDLAAWL